MEFGVQRDCLLGLDCRELRMIGLGEFWNIRLDAAAKGLGPRPFTGPIRQRLLLGGLR